MQLCLEAHWSRPYPNSFNTEHDVHPETKTRQPSADKDYFLFRTHRIIHRLPVLANAVRDCMRLQPFLSLQPWATSKANSRQNSLRTFKNTLTVSNQNDLMPQSSTKPASFQSTRRNSSNGQHPRAFEQLELRS